MCHQAFSHASRATWTPPSVGAAPRDGFLTSRRLRWIVPAAAVVLLLALSVLGSASISAAS